MASSAPISGVAVPISIPRALAAIRDRWDLAAASGAQPHVTVLYPFLPEDALVPDVRAAFEAVAATVAPFDVAFREVRRFDTVVWLDPLPADPFLALTAAMVDRWPGHRPYGGVHDEVIPHLTVTESADAPFAEVESSARAIVPFTARAERLELWLQDDAGRWRPHWRVPLGGAAGAEPR